MNSKKRTKQNDLLFILVSSFIVVVAWISFNIYHIIVTSTINQHIQYQLTPIDPTFSQQIMQELKTREDINPLYGATAVSSQSASTVSPEPSLTPTITASQSSTGETNALLGQ
ncbi:MAG TPA: hypothetical protein VLF93_03770 [Candidatus Saccharimonadales bacterium]|nr:hypothetical protein [Candidatus Saccharimonadales bacterium]